MTAGTAGNGKLGGGRYGDGRLWRRLGGGGVAAGTQRRRQAGRRLWCGYKRRRQLAGRWQVRWQVRQRRASGVDGDGGLGGGRCGEGAKGNVLVQNKTTAGEDRRSVGGRERPHWKGGWREIEAACLKRVLEVTKSSRGDGKSSRRRARRTGESAMTRRA